MTNVGITTQTTTIIPYQELLGNYDSEYVQFLTQ